MNNQRTIVYTDGACLGNPGPGGWAWAVPGGRWRSGAEARTTNQRMEIAAALDAARSMDGPLEVVSDSTYVVNCFKRDWWKKWVVNGWLSTSRQPVANKDLWEPLVDLYQHEPGRLEFRWVKGHSTDPFNDLVDRLAVAAATAQRGSEGELPPPAGSLGRPDAPSSANRPAPGAHISSARAVLARLPTPLPGLSPGARLRSAVDGDAEAIAELWRVAGARPTVTDNVATVRQVIAYDPEAVIVAEAGSQLIGTLIAGFDGWRAALHRLAVHPEWRLQGVAMGLVAEAERRLVNRGAQRVGGIVATDDETAVTFWTAAGYERQPEYRFVKNLP